MLPITRGFRTHAPLLAILASAAALRFYHVDFQSVWVDELSTLIQSTPNQSLLDTYRSIYNNDLQPPLYFMVLKYLFRLFGYTTLVMRVFSAVLGVAGVWSIYLLCRELTNKQTALYASLLLSINYFHILYSQEGRPYAFLVLFTCFSFYSFCLFLRDTNWRNTLFWAVSTASMLYGHPIALFALVGQLLAFAWYFYTATPAIRKRYLRMGSIAGFVTCLLYIPAVPILLSASRVSAFWIPLPDNSTFSLVLAEFFGSSEMLLAFVYLLLIAFFMQLFRGDEAKSTPDYKRLFIVLMPWLICCLLIPYIRSFLKVPMIIPRYLNVVLPVVIIMIAVALQSIQATILRRTLLLFVVVISLTDLFVVKDFYKRPMKTDFRGVSDYVKAGLAPNEELVSRVGYHYQWFFDQTTPRHAIYWNLLQNYVNDIRQRKEPLRSGFWYLDAQGVPLEISGDADNFLRQNYVADRWTNRYMAFGVHYTLKTPGRKLLAFPGQPGLTGAYGAAWNMTEHVTLLSDSVWMEPGRYHLTVSAGSQLAKLLNRIPAHISVSINGVKIGGLFAAELHGVGTTDVGFHISHAGKYAFGFLFDNPYTQMNESRAAIFAGATCEPMN